MDDEQPVTLVASRFEEWADHYARFAAAILEVLPEAHCEHIGSTSVPDLPAKDVIDVIVGVKVSSVQNAARALKMAGFDLEGMKPGHCWLAWPSRRHRESVVHVVAFEGTEWSARIAFRDLLREDPAARAEYFEAKKIAADAASGWSDYTAAKYPTVARLLTRTPSLVRRDQSRGHCGRRRAGTPVWSTKRRHQFGALFRSAWGRPQAPKPRTVELRASA